MRKILTRPTQITITAGSATKTFEAKLFKEYRWLGDEIDVTIAANDDIVITVTSDAPMLMTTGDLKYRLGTCASQVSPEFVYIVAPSPATQDTFYTCDEACGLFGSGMSSLIEDCATAATEALGGTSTFCFHAER